jgi:hypothetical protein
MSLNVLPKVLSGSEQLTAGAHAQKSDVRVHKLTCLAVALDQVQIRGHYFQQTREAALGFAAHDLLHGHEFVGVAVVSSGGCRIVVVAALDVRTEVELARFYGVTRMRLLQVFVDCRVINNSI